jgi:DNA-binding winged helix-turn-helix (wHTH) protein
MARKRKIEIARWSTGLLPGQSGLVIAGRRVAMGKKQSRLLMQLHKAMGSVVPYDKLCSIIGSTGARGKRALRAHVGRINRMLTARKPPVFVTVAREIGYALCELAI